jgi:hypothetical protein
MTCGTGCHDSYPAGRFPGAVDEADVAIGGHGSQVDIDGVHRSQGALWPEKVFNAR